MKLMMRRILYTFPEFVHKILTKHYINNAIGFIMTDEDRNACLSDEKIKSEVLAKYKKKYPQQVKRMNFYIRKLLKSKSKLSQMSDTEQEKILKDMEFCWFAYGFQIDEYIFLDLNGVNKTHQARGMLVSDAERIAFRFSANDLTYTALSDKSTAYEILKKFYKRDVVIINSKKDFRSFSAFVSKHPLFVQKAVRSSRGESVILVDIKDFAYEGGNVYFNSLIDQGKFILEEVIVQTDDMKQYNQDSVNTVRVSTFMTKNGVEPAFGFLRTGRAGSFIDNCATGGVFATVDCKKGIVISDACDELGNRYVLHPDSEIMFKGFKLPDWEEAISIVKEAAMMAPNTKYLSWDLAHSIKYGWVIVEVNTSGQFMWQAGTLKGTRKELEKLVDNMDLIVSCKIKA